MPQKYKVYIKDKVIIFRKSKTTLSETENQLVCVEPSGPKIKEYVSGFEKNIKAEKLLIVSSEPKKAFTLFASDYTPIIAAGGIVKNEKGDILIIFRNGKWDLPKGKAEKGERPRQTAIREVKEETGLTDVTIIKKQPTTLHIYKENSKKILKKTYWYEMLTLHHIALTPQTEEGISEAKWVGKAEIENILENTYLSLFGLISNYMKRNHR